MKKVLAITIMILFISVSVISSTGKIVSLDDTTPPVTTHSLNPPEPDGENGYYVNDVDVMLNATDDDSGVKEIRYRIEGGSWHSIPGDNGKFIMDVDGNDALIEYYAIDNAGNEEDRKAFTIDMDQTVPVIDGITWFGFMEDRIWYAEITAHALDETSGMERVEFYIEDEYQETIEGSGSDYKFSPIKWSIVRHVILWFHYYDRAGNVLIANDTLTVVYPPPETIYYTGLILNPEISKEKLTFFAIIVQSCFFWPYLLIFEHVTIPFDYDGYVGKYFISITLNDWYP